jgi:hypothetical protein
LLRDIARPHPFLESLNRCTATRVPAGKFARKENWLYSPELGRELSKLHTGVRTTHRRGEIRGDPENRRGYVRALGCS